MVGRGRCLAWWPAASRRRVWNSCWNITRRWVIKLGSGITSRTARKAPLAWEVAHTMITPKDENGLPGPRWHLVVGRNLFDREEVKFFVSNAPSETAVETLLLVAFSRWRVERCFEDQKEELGLDQWEGRLWLSWKRHLILTSISYLFLARVREQLRGEKSATDRLPSAHCPQPAGSQLVA